MRQYITATIASATLIISAMAAAADPAPQSQVHYNPQPQQYYYTQPGQQTQQQYSASEPQRQTFFGRMMDLERRKNQAILRFFGFR